MFAGPNGSGKTVLFEQLRRENIIHTEFYIGADRIETDLKNYRKFHFNAYHVQSDHYEFIEHIRRSGLFTIAPDKSFIDHLRIEQGVLHVDLEENQIDSYLASFISSYVTEKLLQSGQSFCLETVLSHASKLDLFELAKKSGYQTYLYFICTENFNLNIERVKLRVAGGGHDVSTEKIIERFNRSMHNFTIASELADVVYLIDNSVQFRLVLEVRNAQIANRIENIPFWLFPFIPSRFRPAKGKKNRQY